MFHSLGAKTIFAALFHMFGGEGGSVPKLYGRKEMEASNASDLFYFPI